MRNQVWHCFDLTLDALLVDGRIVLRKEHPEVEQGWLDKLGDDI